MNVNKLKIDFLIKYKILSSNINKKFLFKKMECCNICLTNNENNIYCSASHKHAYCTLCYDEWRKTSFELHKDVICPMCGINMERCLDLDLSKEEDESEEEEDFSIYFEENDEDENEIKDNSNYYDKKKYFTYENNLFTEYYDTEKKNKLFEVTKINNKFEGIATAYYSNGNILRISNYENDILNGFIKEYDYDNNLYGFNHIINNNMHGFNIKFDKDNNIICNETYINGKKIDNSFLENIKSLRKD